MKDSYIDELKENEKIKPIDYGEEDREDIQPGGDDNTFPLLALRGLVIFPHMVIPLLVGRKKSLAALKEAVDNNRKLVVVAQKDEGIEDPDVSDLYQVGTLVEIKQLMKLPDNTIRITVEGLERTKLTEVIRKEPYWEARVELLDISGDKTTEIEALMRTVISQFEEYIKIGKKVPPETLLTVNNVEDPGRLVDIIVSFLSLKLKEQQLILETFAPIERLKLLIKIMDKELEVLEIEQKIQSRVKKQVEKTQKEYYLREQLKAIKEELGYEDEDEEIEEYLEKIQEAGLPEDVEEKAIKEVERLRKMPPMSSEGVVVRNYLDCLLELPWQERTEDRLDIKEASRVLDEDHYGLKDVKERILEFLAVKKLAPKTKSPILCLVGAPGVGKTSLARSVARALGREFIRVSLGGVRDEAEIRGHRRTYVGSRPGRIINALRNAGSKNPVFLLDEVDKMSTDFRGDPSAALLEVLDPEQNHEFSDHYLEVPFDLSEVLFITTANVTYSIPQPLLDRMELIRIPGYTENEKIEIARRHLLPKQFKNHGLNEDQLQISNNALHQLIQEYTREAGVRELERSISTICRKVAREVVEGKNVTSRITVQNIRKYLGIPKFRSEKVRGKDRIGVVTGLAYTEYGGDILDIEVSVLPGSGKLILTGQLGDVMQESARAALSYARSKQKELGLEKDFHEKYDFHIHVPEGAVPKDGPSAGITIATAIISALTGKKVPAEIAMTGEITLRGRVLQIGGLKEKVLAGHRSGIKKIIIPAENEPHLEEIPDQVKRKLEFIKVDHMDDVLKVALQ